MAQVAPRSTVGQLTGTPGYGGGRALARAAVRKPTVVRPATQRPGADPILTLVQQILKLETAPVTAAENQRQASVARQQSDMRAAQTALVAQLQRGAQTGGQAYDQAIASTDALGRQAASYFQGQSPDAATQANLKAIGAPLAQQQAVGAANASLFSGGPNYVLGAQIPGAALNAQKAAQVGYLAGLPTVAALQGQTGMRANQLADQAAHQTYIQNLMRVTSQTPQLVQQYRVQRQNDLINAQNAQTKAAAVLQNAQYLNAQLGLKGQALALATKKEQDAYNVATQNVTIAQQRADTYGTSVTNTNTNAAERNRIAAQKAAAAAAAGKVKKGKQRQSYFYTQRSRAIAAAKALYGTPTKGKGGALTFTSPTGGTYKQPTSRVAYNKLFATYGPPLKAQGFTDAAIRRMLNTALRIAGYKTPGSGSYRGKN